jgi:hypothetical protein
MWIRIRLDRHLFLQDPDSHPGPADPEPDLDLHPLTNLHFFPENFNKLPTLALL